MRNLHKLSLLAVLVSSPGWTMTFSSTIKTFQPPITLGVEQPPAIKYTPPGTIAVTAKSYCGDGDVVHFAGENPSFDFVPNTTAAIDAIAGYWIVEDGATGNALLPTAANWFPIAYQKIGLSGSGTSTSQFFSISQNIVPSNTNVMKLIRSDLVNLYSAAVDSFESNKSFKVFTAILSCSNPDGAENLITDNSGAYVPTPIELVHSLKEIRNEVNNAFNTTNFATILNNKKIKIDLKPANQRNLGEITSPKPYNFTLGNQGEAISGTLYDTYKNILEATYPAQDSDPTVEEHTAIMQGLSWRASLQSGMSGDKIAYCNAQGANSDKNAKTYVAYEPFPLNLSCKNLFNINELSDSYAALFNPSSLPSPAAFATAQKDLAKRFFMAAVYQTAQNYFNTMPTNAKTGCFQKSGQPHLIHRITASYPLNYGIVANGHYVISGNTPNHLHPEQLFAISDYTRYFSNEVLAIWGQTAPSQNTGDVKTRAINLPLGNKNELQLHPVDSGTFGGTSININFKARHKDQGQVVSGVCIVYC